MPKKITTYITFIAFLHLIGCYSFETISFNEFEEELKASETPTELFINTKDFKRYHCGGESFKVVKDSLKIKGTIVTESNEAPFEGKIPLSEINSIEVKKLDMVTSSLIVISVIGCTAALVLMVNSAEKASCSKSPDLSGWN